MDKKPTLYLVPALPAPEPAKVFDMRRWPRVVNWQPDPPRHEPAKLRSVPSLTPPEEE